MRYKALLGYLSFIGVSSICTWMTCSLYLCEIFHPVHSYMISHEDCVNHRRRPLSMVEKQGASPLGI